MRRLNRILGTTAAIVALVGLPAAALAGIATTAHDLSGKAYTGEICNVCHTPHSGDTTVAAPLWDHDITTVTNYTVYTSATLTAESGAIGQPGDVSLLCLSCHDGTVSVDAFGGSAGGTHFITSASTAYMGTDLSDDHPVGVTYDAALSTADPGLHDPTATDAAIAEKPGNIDVAMLFGTGNDQLECASCHDPHEAAGVTPFLRKSNATSALCLTCHNK